MTDRRTLIAEFIVEHWLHDRDALLCDLISRWPDVSAEELQDAIDAAAERRHPERFMRVLEPIQPHQGELQ